MHYIPHTEEEKKLMLKELGLNSTDELFQDIPSSLRAKSFNLPEGKSEFEVVEYFKKLNQKNSAYLINFLGAGFYDHYIPKAVDALASQPQFYTAYTPYQPEASQGWLQAIYEYQTAICELTGLDVANASLYDGGSALFEAAMMAVRLTGRKKILLDCAVNPIYRQMLKTYTLNLEIEIKEVFSLDEKKLREEMLKNLDSDTAAIVLQNPNFFGRVDDFSDLVQEAHQKESCAIISVYPVSLGMLKTPAEMGFDIAVGEGQSLGLPLSFGGPYLGFMAAKKECLRQMPGRIVGATLDKEGRRCFVLTLQAREQHIRREKATSNICSNEALCALRALLYLCLLGKQGLKELAYLNYQKAEFAKKELGKIPGVRVRGSIFSFNEFTLELPQNAEEVVERMLQRGYLCGLPLARFYPELENCLLVAVTEKRTKDEIINFCQNLKEVLCS